jgi:sucrose-phosphate synthase
VLIDPLDEASITRALLKILEDKNLWATCSRNGLMNVAKFYSWEAHARNYLKRLESPVFQTRLSARPAPLSRAPAVQTRTRAIFTAIDNTLLGNPEALSRFVTPIRQHHRRVLFGIATGRRLNSVLKLLKVHAIPMPDVLITSLGTEIYTPPQLTTDITWTHHIDHLWTPQVLHRLMDSLPGLTLQEKEHQSRFKLSYYYDEHQAPPLEEILTLLRQHELSAHTSLSFGQFLDFVPARASKEQALRYVANQWKIPLGQVLVNGGSRGDEDMLRGNTLGVVVASPHRQELEQLNDFERVYFSEGSHAAGILEAIDHYRFFH